MVSELRPVMPADLLIAAIEGNSRVLIPRLGLQPDEEPPESTEVPIEASQTSDPEQLQTVQSELQSATGFGDTVLHLLVTRHNRLALKVFQRDRSLLNAPNKLSETPLHYAAKVGNERFISELIEIDHVTVKDAIKEIDENGDTPLHVAAKYGHIFVGCELMRCDPNNIALRVNNEMLFPLQIAIMKKYTKMVIKMLEVNPILACIPFSDGMFPVHVSARMGIVELVIHFMKQYPNCAKLLDPFRRNIFHIAAENNQTNIFTDVFNDTAMGSTAAQMNNATDNEGNTPLHIAAMKGHKSIMKAIWENKMGIDAEKIENNERLTPFKLSKRQLKTNEYIDHYKIGSHESAKGSKFTQEWFDNVMKQAPINKWEKTEVLGLGSVLITTVTFAAAFTIPGGYNQDKGTPVLGKRYMFRAFIVANTLAFIQGFVSLLLLLWKTQARFGARLRFATTFFLLAASSMVVAFGLGMYVTLAPICYPIAVLVLVITLFIGSPVGLVCTTLTQTTIPKSITSNLKSSRRYDIFVLLLFTNLFLLIFGLALL